MKTTKTEIRLVYLLRAMNRLGRERNAMWPNYCKHLIHLKTLKPNGNKKRNTQNPDQMQPMSPRQYPTDGSPISFID